MSITEGASPFNDVHEIDFLARLFALYFHGVARHAAVFAGEHRLADAAHLFDVLRDR